MAISRTELVMRNPKLGITALEDGLFANLLIFDYLYYIFLFGKGKGKGKREGRRKVKREGKGKGEGSYEDNEGTSCEVGSTVIRDYTVHKRTPI